MLFSVRVKHFGRMTDIYAPDQIKFHTLYSVGGWVFVLDVTRGGVGNFISSAHS